MVVSPAGCRGKGAGIYRNAATTDDWGVWLAPTALRLEVGRQIRGTIHRRPRFGEAGASMGDDMGFHQTKTHRSGK
ncbi:MAG: hypothetical protein RLZZ326_1040, partial [Planctomycetota bacterium]